jgi:hypothetical protein
MKPLETTRAPRVRRRVALSLDLVSELVDQPLLELIDLVDDVREEVEGMGGALKALLGYQLY